MPVAQVFWMDCHCFPSAEPFIAEDAVEDHVGIRAVEALRVQFHIAFLPHAKLLHNAAGSGIFDIVLCADLVETDVFEGECEDGACGLRDDAAAFVTV